MKRILSEVMEQLGTEKVFETQTSFGVNVFGKYKPNITFILSKDFEENPLEYREDAMVRTLVRNMNIDFDGDTAVIFGDYWKSKKGGNCFRPKNVAQAQHMLVKIGWGGPFDESRGTWGGLGELYFRRASSNGGGAGYCYLVFPIGFRYEIHSEEVDGAFSSVSCKIEDEAKKVRDQVMQYDREVKAKAEAETKAKAASKMARKGFSTRLEAINESLQKTGKKPFDFGEIFFKRGWEEHLYTEEKISNLEKKVRDLEEEFAEKEHQRFLREEFKSKFQEFEKRVLATGFEISFHEERVHLVKNSQCHGYGHFYSFEGVLSFVEQLKELEVEVAKAKAKAEDEVIHCELRRQGEELGLPQNVRIWRRRGGRTNAGDGWVIGSEGQDRESISNPEMIWRQVLPGEVVLKWSKSCSAASHKFEVIHLPEGGLTEAQFERVAEIEKEIKVEWEGVRGFSTGSSSPPIGQGWGFWEHPEEVEEIIEEEEKKSPSVTSGLFAGKLAGFKLEK